MGGRTGCCEPGHFGPAARTARRGCGYPEDDSWQPAMHSGEAQRAAPRRRERGLPAARPAFDLAGACTSCTGYTCICIYTCKWNAPAATAVRVCQSTFASAVMGRLQWLACAATSAVMGAAAGL
eukprot:scaffold125854_cov57-Phaeocystis_antarctica.AAC.1